MSAQFGKCNFDGGPIDPKDLDRVRPVLAPFGPDGEGYICEANVGILYRSFHTTKESRYETQPAISKSGAIITWDGRLDNREELMRQSRGDLSAGSTDLSIVAWAYEKWGTGAFSRFIGDWALSIWESRTRSLVLAKDLIGSRHLYYFVKDRQVTWCTVLNPLVLFAERPFALEEEYIAGWLSFFPATHLTPYVGIHSVPPGCFISISNGALKTSEYWSFDSTTSIRYRSDAEYEEHFRAVFAQSVKRRLRSDRPVLAELSGGMDSSSIVCMADRLLSRGIPSTPRLDTVSYFNASEPNWDERPYFTAVEQKRAQVGCHIDVGEESFNLELQAEKFAAVPGLARNRSRIGQSFSACIASKGNRVLLSGVGGDEILGGVPTPKPELADLLARGRLRDLFQRLESWALYRRKPWHHLLLETTWDFLPTWMAEIALGQCPQPWLRREFIQRNHVAMHGYRSRYRVRGPLPSFQYNLESLEYLTRQLGCLAPPSCPIYEKRYPYLDRDLLAFIYAIPREQLVRPGQRRSLMRRSLVEIVPEQLLNRRRKAFVIRAPMCAIATNWNQVTAVATNMVSSELGIVDTSAFLSVLQQVRNRMDVPIVSVMRTLEVELWIRHLVARKIVLAGRPEYLERSTSSRLKAWKSFQSDLA